MKLKLEKLLVASFITTPGEPSPGPVTPGNGCVCFAPPCICSAGPDCTDPTEA
jgi:hypothetical protein